MDSLFGCFAGKLSVQNKLFFAVEKAKKMATLSIKGLRVFPCKPKQLSIAVTVVRLD